jgi:hypothetical protein
LRETREELAGAGWLGPDPTINICNGSPVALWVEAGGKRACRYHGEGRRGKDSETVLIYQRLAVRWAGVKRSHGETTQRREAVAAAGRQAGRRGA